MDRRQITSSVNSHHQGAGNCPRADKEEQDMLTGAPQHWLTVVIMDWLIIMELDEEQLRVERPSYEL